MSSRIAKLLWIATEKVGLTLLSLVTFFVYAKFLGPSELGLAILALSIVQGLALVFANLFEDALVRHQQPSPSDFHSAFWGGLVLTSGLSLVVLLAAYSWLSQPLAALVYWALPILPLTATTSIYVAQLRRQGQFKLLSQRQLLGRTCGALFGLAMIAGGYGALAIIGQALIGSILGFATLLIGAEYRPRWQLKMNHATALVSVGWPLALKRLSWDALIRGIPLVLGVVSGAAAVGFYSLAWRLVEMPRSAMVSGILSYALPVFSRRQQDSTQLQTLFCDATKATSLFLVPCFVGLAALVPIVVPWIFGPEWQPAVLPAQVLAIAMAISCTRVFVPVAFTAVSKTSTNLIVDMTTSALALVITCIAGPVWGALAGAMAMLLRVLIALPFGILALQRVVGIDANSQWHAVRPVILASFLMMAFVSAIVANVPLSALVTSGLALFVGIAAYGISLSLINPSWWRDLRGFITS
ncbi:lipopolysaccharide biosynthesis protein [Neiella marina]|uniref:Lipopolysaccharide biosynthesis protein n=1 Tax=Neiella marina TaxID=508461 RepID=A0A8J2U253_9GAMM|nr:oligosaccharide flippase family protein [Neiella marina]GGA64537.1 lipopolysaccharide biosynthesis protein [Neiella marina]